MIRRNMMILKKAGSVAHVWNRNGMKMLVLEDGGRILGLYAPDSDENFFWVNPCVYDKDQLIWKDSWPNPGGDRCWLSPVCGIRIGRSGGHIKYQVPPRVDPGFRHVERCKGGMIRILNVGKIFMRRRGKDDTFALERYLSWADNPLRYNKDDWARGLSYAGYSQKIKLESFSCIENKLSPWSILQLPIGGEIIIPLYGKKSLVRRILGVNVEGAVKFDDGKIQIKSDGKEDCFVSIPPQMSTGRIGYVSQAGKDRTLVVRNFNVNPSGEYLNCIIGASLKPGFSFQCRVVSDGRFSHVELHTHLPCNGTISVSGTLQTWCFRGNKRNILNASVLLLGCQSLIGNRR